MKVVIVGGVAGGATAAARIRRLDEKAEITVFERSGFVSYANCGLPYYIGDVITEKEQLTLQSPEGFKRRFRIDVRTEHEVIDIDRVRKAVKVKNLKDGNVFEEEYDKLILSPGAKPVIPDVPGTESEKIFTLRTVEDTYRIKEYVNGRNIRRAVIVGGGYIGVEAAENLSGLGIDVTIIQRPEQLMNTFDYDMAALIHAKLRQGGINLMPGSDVTGFSEEEDEIRVHVKDKGHVAADMVLLAVGVRPDSSLAEACGLKLGIKNSIVVDDRMQTSDHDIYAVGDAVQIVNSVTGTPALISLAGPANKEGRIAADNICGIESHYRGSHGSSVIKVLDMTVAQTGLTEKAAKAAGIPYDSVVLSPASHATYYPGARIMTMKVVFEKDTLRLLGAQAAGYEGVDKRIDVIATAISGGIKADELKDLDLAYAPPYSSAKDPVNMAGFIIENIGKGLVKQFHWDDVDRLRDDRGVTLLDTRTGYEYGLGHIEEFINIPLDELRENMIQLDKEKPVYVMCQSGLRSYLACRILAQNGFDCYNFSGGYRFYELVSREKMQSEYSHPCGADK